MADLQTLVDRSEVGTIRPWTKTAAPAGFLLCDGSAVSRTTYADLFEETPHGLACLIITVVGSFKLEKSMSNPANISL